MDRMTSEEDPGKKMSNLFMFQILFLKNEF